MNAKGVVSGLCVAAVIGAAALAGSRDAEAHAFSIGYENAGPGAVNIWLGTYNHGGHHLEGSLRLEGVMGTVFGPTTVPFSLTAGSYPFPPDVPGKPAGLIDGVTNFFVSTPLGVPGPLVGSDTIWLTTLCPACGPANHWQGVNFSGLLEGFYQFTYVPIGNPSQEWDPYNPSLNGVFFLSNQIVNPTVPEPATLALIGLGLVAACAVRRRHKTTA
jgi:hypothetical protein